MYRDLQMGTVTGYFEGRGNPCELQMQTVNEYHIKWGPCHHFTARPQAFEGNNGPQIWKVAANKVNRQSRGVDKG